jgi:hypothetical protein
MIRSLELSVDCHPPWKRQGLEIQLIIEHDEASIKIF